MNSSKTILFCSIVFACLIGISLVTYSDAQEFEQYGVRVETVAENLQVPWEIAFAPDGRIFFTERVGNVRVIEDGTLVPEPVLVLDVGRVEGGLLGLALDPNFEENHYMYLYYTYQDFLETYNKVVRYTEDNNKLTDEMILLDKIPGGPVHDGGRIVFGPDDKLYITTGDAGNAALSQDLDSVAGKILRINPDGTIPEDNPFDGSPVYSYGHRNPQGIDWDPLTGKLVIAEHGPSGERGFAHDEINVIEPGANYGWPDAIGDEHDSPFVAPIIHTGTTTWAPSGATFYDSDNIAEWENKYFVATLRGQHLRMLDLDLLQNDVEASTALFSGTFGRLRTAEMGPDGNMYILTSNRDGRGSPAVNDDRILRIVPLSATSEATLEESLEFSEVEEELEQIEEEIQEIEERAEAQPPDTEMWVIIGIIIAAIVGGGIYSVIRRKRQIIKNKSQ